FISGSAATVAILGYQLRLGAWSVLPSISIFFVLDWAINRASRRPGVGLMRALLDPPNRSDLWLDHWRRALDHDAATSDPDYEDLIQGSRFPQYFVSLLKRRQVPGWILHVGVISAIDAAWFVDQGFAAVGVNYSDGRLRWDRKLHPDLPLVQMDPWQMGFGEKSMAGIWHAGALHHSSPEL